MTGRTLAALAFSSYSATSSPAYPAGHLGEVLSNRRDAAKTKSSLNFL
jgi:hypothetical protein